MDELESSDELEMDDVVEATVETPRPNVALNAKIIRVGGGICVVGVIVTLLGAGWQASAGPYAQDGGLARGTHSLGLLILLFGSVTALFGYRLPWLANLFRPVRSQPNSLAREHNRSARPHQSTPYLFPVFAAGVGFWIVSFLVAWLSPMVVTGAYLTLVTFFFSAAAFVVIASGTRLQRAFCIGAVIPLLLALCSIWVYSFSALGRSMGRGRSWGEADLWLSLTSQAAMVVDWLASVGDLARVPVLLAWITALAIGSSAVLVRVLLMNFNHEDRERDSD